MPPPSPEKLASLDIRELEGGALLAVQAQPGARRNGLAGIHNGRLKVAVTQVAEKGKANKALIQVLAATLGVSRSAVSLVSGETTALKTFAVAGRSAAEVRTQIATVLGAEEV